MRIVFVHGINQQGKDPERLKQEWKTYLEVGIGSEGALDGVEIDMPFYGDRLDLLTRGDKQAFAVAQGPGSMDNSEARFAAAMLEEIAEAENLDEAEIDAAEAELTGPAAVGQGLPMHRRINAILRVLQGVSPLKGHVALGFVRQANAYLKKPGVGGRIDADVVPIFRKGPAVIVAHSLGTVITFKLLRQLALEGAPMEVPLLVTLGSPLSLRSVRGALGPQYLIPKKVGDWCNGYDPDDSVSLGASLTPNNFTDGIRNITDIENVPGDAHSIEGYLGDARIARAIYEAANSD